jgi:hypothetical protein
MGRWRKRVRLEDGPKLDLNELLRDGLAKPGEKPAGWHFLAMG